jgi:UPF0716 protein FxsA
MAVWILVYLVAELVAVTAVASWIGLGWTLILFVAGMFLGGALARREGATAMRHAMETARSGRSAHVEMTDGMLVGIGGILIAIPGFLTDLVGFALLIPPLRGIIGRRWVASMERKSPGLRDARIRGFGTPEQSGVVEGEVVNAEASRKDDPKHPIIEIEG